MSKRITVQITSKIYLGDRQTDINKDTIILEGKLFPIGNYEYQVISNVDSVAEYKYFHLGKGNHSPYFIKENIKWFDLNGEVYKKVYKKDKIRIGYTESFMKENRWIEKTIYYKDEKKIILKEIRRGG